MPQKLLLLFLGLNLLFSCKKEESTQNNYNFSYKLTGKYYRDSTVNSNGYKMLDLKSNGNYCWIRRQNNLDSLYCYGTYEQTSDTSMLWNGIELISFKITPIDSIVNGVKLEITGTPAVPPLYGFASRK
jgi:hypothetical protein